MYGTAEVDNRARELGRDKKALTKHALDVSTKDHSPERGQRAENKVGRNELQVNLQAKENEIERVRPQVNSRTHHFLAGIEGWASRLGPNFSQTELQK